MGCLSPDILRLYPHPVVALFSSTVDTSNSNEFNAAHVADTHLGYVTELEKAGQHATAPGSVAVLETPYSTRLRPNAMLAELEALRGIPCIIESVVFYGVDATMQTPGETEPISGNTYQDPVVAADMITSQGTDMDANVASHFRNALVGNWQPNWFRPALIVNGQNIFANLAGTQLVGTNGDRNHRGDLSIGLPLPFTMDLAKEYPNGITSIEAHAQLVQYIPNTASARKYVRYPVHAVVVIRHQ